MDAIEALQEAKVGARYRNEALAASFQSGAFDPAEALAAGALAVSPGRATPFRCSIRDHGGKADNWMTAAGVPAIRYNEAILLLVSAGVSSVLDYGCGRGGLAHSLRWSGWTGRYLGCDVDAEAIDIAANGPGVFRHFDAGQAAPFTDGAAEAVLASGVLPVLTYDEGHFVLEDMARLATETIILSNTRVGCQSAEVGLGSRHGPVTMRIWTLDEIRDALRRHGFSLTTTEPSAAPLWLMPEGRRVFPATNLVFRRAL